MLNRSPQHGDRREPGTSARQAAEALFAPKPQRAEPPVREPAPTSEAIRKPRVLTIAAVTPVPQDEPAASSLAGRPREPVIPTAHIARIRAWLKYGMTTAQVAEMYGVAAGEVERLLGLA